MKKVLFILSGSLREAALLAGLHNLNPKSWAYLHNPNQLRATKSALYIRYGAWQDQRYIDDIENMLINREAIQVFDIGDL
jgi:hypothetical protein